jgi:hypothetical protein
MANDVWRALPALNGDRRIRRWTPASALALPVGIRTAQFNGGALDPGFFPFALIDQRHLKAATFAPAHIHAQQHFRPILRIGSAGAGFDREECITVVIGTVEQHLDLKGFDGFAGTLEFGSDVRLKRVVVFGGGKFDQIGKCRQLTINRFDALNFFLQAGQALHDRLRLAGIVPEIGIGSALFERGNLALFRRQVKDARERCRSASAGPPDPWLSHNTPYFIAYKLRW